MSRLQAAPRSLRASRQMSARSSWRERLRGHPWDRAIRDLIYKYIGIGVRQQRVQAINRSDPDLEIETYLRSHVCLKPFTRLEATNRGLAHVCIPDWLPTPIGDLDSNLLRQWSGPVMKKIRASMIDGSYEYCSRILCSDISNRRLPHRDSEEVRAVLAEFASSRDRAPPPKEIVLSHDRSCNLTCPSCRTAPIVADKAKQAEFDAVFECVLVPFIGEAQSVYMTGSGDPFASNHFRTIIQRLEGNEFPHLTLDLHTNAQLFDERAWSKLRLAGRVGYVHISIDAARPETYAVVRRGGSFDRLRKNLAFIKSLREAGEIHKLEFSMVVQAANFREMPEFVRLGQEFGADVVSFQMIANWGTFNEAEFEAEFIGSRSHPNHHELVEIVRAPELSLPIAQVGNILGYTRHSEAR